MTASEISAVMRASTYERYGDPSVLTVRSIPRPVPSEHELLIRVRYATVNRTDCAMLRAKPFIMRFLVGLWRPRHKVLGTDFAGEVEALGSGVTGFAVGDRVFGFDDEGLHSHAEFLTVDPRKIAAIHIEDSVSLQTAAASAEGAHYARNIIERVGVQAGQTALINGATGAIGSAIVQLLVHQGVHVTAVCGADQVERVRGLGAEQVIDYEREDFTRLDARYHVVLDAVGKSSFRRCRRLLHPGGVYASTELGWLGQNPFLALLTPWFRGRRVVFPIPRDPVASLKLVRDLAREQKFAPLIDRTYPLAEIADAFRYVETGQKIGNVVLDLGEVQEVGS